MLRTKLLLLSLFLLVIQAKFNAQQLQANFEADVKEGCGNLVVTFTDLSTGGTPTSWNWNFGNGNTSTLQNPSASYNTSGVYPVILTVSDGINSDTETKTGYIRVFKNPTANFFYTPTSGCSPLTVNFTSNANVGDTTIQSLIWDFKDGSPASNLENPQHIYQTNQNYSPSLQVIDNHGCTDNITLGPISVIPSPNIAFTTAGPRTACTDSLIVSFQNNSSTGANVTYLWEFGDGATSTDLNPTHTYRGYGSYDVRLTVTDPNCSSTFLGTNYIRLEQPQALFNVPKKEVCFGESIPFDNQSTGALVYSWNFGDGSGSSQKNPVKTYADSGRYVITLTISGLGCVDQYKDTVYVQRTIADFITDTTFTCNLYDTVFFTNTSVNASQFEWRIGWGGIGSSGDSTQIDFTVNTVHYYNAREGVFSDTLIATSTLGCIDTLIKDSNRVVDHVDLFITNDSLSAYDPTHIGCLPDSLGFNSRAILSIPNDSIISYSWDFSAGQTSDVKDPPGSIFFDEDTITIIQLTVMSKLGCKRSDTVFIDLGPPIEPMFNTFPDTLCQGDSLLITGTSPRNNEVELFEYFISTTSIQGGISDNLPNNFFLTYTDTGYFDITGIYTNDGCPDTTVIDSAFFVQGPIVPFLTVNSNCLIRNQVNFRSEMLGVTRFYWDFGDGSPLDSINTNPTHTYNTSDFFYATLTTYNDSNDCPPLIDTVRVNLIPVQTLRILPTLKNFCLDDKIQMKHTASTSYDSSQWKFNGQVVSIDTSFQWTFDQRGIIPVELSTLDFLGCRDTVYDSIYVSRPIANYRTSFLNSCLPNEIQFFDSSLVDTTILRNFWVRENGDTLIAPDPIATYSTPGDKEVFYYVQNIYGCADSIKRIAFSIDSFEVKMRSGNTDICLGDSLTFRNTSNDPTANYIWDFDDGNTLTTGNDTVGYRFNQAGTFTVLLSGTNNKGCLLKDSVIINVEATPTIGFTSDVQISECYPFPVNFQDTSSGNIVSWKWKFGDGDSSVIQNPFHNYLTPGDYDIFLEVTTANGCSNSLTKNNFIQVNGPTAQVSIDLDDACVNEPILFTMLNPIDVDSFIWVFGDGATSNLASTTHAYQRTGRIFPTLFLFNASGNCRISIIDSVDIFDIKADFTISKDTGCTPFTATFTNTSIGATSFNWIFEDGSTSTNQTEIRNYNQSGNYLIQLAISSPTCIDTSKQTLRVFDTPVAIATPDTGICFGDSVQLIASGGHSYEWTPNRFLTNNMNDTTIAFPDSTAIYTVEVSSLEGCKDSTQTEVFVVQAPNYTALLDSQLFIGETVNIDITAGSGFNYRWTPSEGLSCDDCPNPVAKPLSSQVYIVEITDNFGCFSILDTVEFNVTEAYSLDVPSAFSPNGDGVNDLVYAKGWGLKELIAFKIYNRFGELVFESNSFDIGWDGTYRGKPQNVETYVYTVEALTYGERILKKKGNISLLR